MRLRREASPAKPETAKMIPLKAVIRLSHRTTAREVVVDVAPAAAAAAEAEAASEVVSAVAVVEVAAAVGAAAAAQTQVTDTP